MAQKGYIKNSLTKDLGAPEMANMFQGIFGASGIMSLYENLACVKVDNNTVRMSSGAYNLSGHLLGIAKGTTEDLTIDSGTSGQNRNDLVVAEFVRNGGGLGVDTLHFTVVKGTSTSGTAADPTLTQQEINAAGVTRQEALYRVKVVGTEITAVEKVAGSVSNLNLVQSGGLAGAFASMPFVGTAPIVASDSSANVRWIKYADGTMIYIDERSYSLSFETAAGALYRTGNFNSNTFTQSFVGNYFAVPYLAEQDTGVFVPRISAKNADSVTYSHAHSVVSGTRSFKAGVLAIGRWK